MASHVLIRPSVVCGTDLWPTMASPQLTNNVGSQSSCWTCVEVWYDSISNIMVYESVWIFLFDVRCMMFGSSTHFSGATRVLGAPPHSGTGERPVLVAAACLKHSAEEIKEAEWEAALLAVTSFPQGEGIMEAYGSIWTLGVCWFHWCSGASRDHEESHGITSTVKKWL